MYDNLKDFLVDEAIAEQEKYAAIKEDLKKVLNVNVKDVYKFGSNPNIDKNHILYSIHRCGDLEYIHVDEFINLKKLSLNIEKNRAFIRYDDLILKVFRIEKDCVFTETNGVTQCILFENFEIWQPKCDDIVWSTFTSNKTLLKVEKIYDNGNYLLIDLLNDKSCIEDKLTWSDFVNESEPFNNNLPTFLNY